jgi:hypothetical protein
MCGIEWRWVEEINHKIGVEGCSINILIAQLPNRPHAMRANCVELKDLQRLVEWVRYRCHYRETPWHNFSLQPPLIIQKAENTQHIHNKSSPLDITLSQFNPIHISISQRKQSDTICKKPISAIRVSHPFDQPSICRTGPWLTSAAYSNQPSLSAYSHWYPQHNPEQRNKRATGTLNKSSLRRQSDLFCTEFLGTSAPVRKVLSGPVRLIACLCTILTVKAQIGKYSGQLSHKNMPTLRKVLSSVAWYSQQSETEKRREGVVEVNIHK